MSEDVKTECGATNVPVTNDPAQNAERSLGLAGATNVPVADVPVAEPKTETELGKFTPAMLKKMSKWMGQLPPSIYESVNKRMHEDYAVVKYLHDLDSENDKLQKQIEKLKKPKVPKAPKVRTPQINVFEIYNKGGEEALRAELLRFGTDELSALSRENCVQIPKGAPLAKEELVQNIIKTVLKNVNAGKLIRKTVAEKGESTPLPEV